MEQPPQASMRSRPLWIAILAAMLLVLHQDYWFWTNRTLVFGILPMGLFWHICISIAAMLTWYLATRIAWPVELTSDSIAGPTSDSRKSDSCKSEQAESSQEIRSKSNEGLH